MKCIGSKIKEFFIKNKANLVYLSIFIIIALPFFINQIVYITKYTMSVIYMDKIRLLSQSLDKIMTNSLTIGDCFTVHDGHFSVGTYLLLAFEVKVLNLNNDYIFSLSIPFVLLATYIIVWCFRLTKSQKLTIKDLIFAIVYCFVSSVVIFSLFCWETIWFSYGSIIFFSNLGFILATGLLYKSLTSKHTLGYLIASVIIGVSTAFLFGSGYSYSFMIAELAILVFCVLFNWKQNRKNSYYYIGAGAIYLVLFIVFVVILMVNGNSHGGNSFDLLAMFRMYIYSLGSLIISSEMTAVPLATHYVAGSAILIASLLALFFYFKKKYFKQNIFSLFLFIFSEATLASIVISRIGFGELSGDASRYYTTYMYLSLFIIEVFLAIIYDATADFKKVLNILSIVVASSFVISFIPSQFKFNKQEHYIAYYRSDTSKSMIKYSLIYDEVDDETLSNLYQETPQNVKECFDMLKKYSLYTYDVNCQYTSFLTDDFVTTGLALGTYDPEGASRFTSKNSTFILKNKESLNINLQLYNPGNFKDNTYSIYLNNECLVNEKAIPSGTANIETIHFERGINKLKIVLDHDTCPAEEGMSGDIRHLGLLINNCYQS